MSNIPKSITESKEMIALSAYENACNAMAMVFLKRFFDYGNGDFYWVADEIGGVLCVNDYFFNMDLIVEAMRLKPSEEMFFNFYDYEMSYYNSSKKPKVKYNLKNFILNYENISKPV